MLTDSPQPRSAETLVRLAREFADDRLFLIVPDDTNLQIICDIFLVFYFMKRRDVILTLRNVGALYQYRNKGIPNYGGPYPLFAFAEMLTRSDYHYIKEAQHF